MKLKQPKKDVEEFFQQCQDYLSDSGSLVAGTLIGPSYRLHLFRYYMINMFGKKYEKLELHYDLDKNTIDMYFCWGFWAYWFWYVFGFSDRKRLKASASRLFKDVQLTFKRRD